MFLLRLEPSKARPFTPAPRVIGSIFVYHRPTTGLFELARRHLYIKLNTLNGFTTSNTRIDSSPYSFVCAHMRVMENALSSLGYRYRKGDQETPVAFGVLEVYRNRHATQDQDKHIEEYCASSLLKIQRLNYLIELLC